MNAANQTNRRSLLPLIAICLLFAVLSTVGITWGLPSRDIDKYLYPTETPWSGEKIYRLAHASEKFDATRGADVDANPLNKQGLAGKPILLTGSDEALAKIYLRYRLFTYQPDEMITMMSLAGMHPGRLDLDPRLYQYGGLFIYPVGALIKLCDVVGLIDVRSDVPYYLDHPDEFGKFYVVARAYSAAWGILGIVLVFLIARRLAGGRQGDGMGAMLRRSEAETKHAEQEGSRDSARGGPSAGIEGSRAEYVGSAVRTKEEASSGAMLPRSGSMPAATLAGLLAALLFAFMPVVVCMAHEAKPHLAGAVLMLAAVWFAMRHLDTVRARRHEHDAYNQSRDREGAVHTASSAPHGRGALGNPQTDIARRDTSTTSRDWWLMCIACGAALGMVLSSLPIFVLIPVVTWMSRTHAGTGGTAARVYLWFKRTVLGKVVAVAAYLAVNPYVLINALFHPDILSSNLGNSTAMYRVDRLGAGFSRVLELTRDGATLPILILGVLAMAVALWHRRRIAWPLIVAAGVFFVQFVLLGAGKPGEYGRFGIFPNTALVIGAACLLTARWHPQRFRPVRLSLTAVVIAWMALCGFAYLRNFQIDTTPQASRLRAVRAVATGARQLDSAIDVALIAEPAPYCCPPLPFADINAYLFSDLHAAEDARQRAPNRWLLVYASDQRPIIPGPASGGNTPRQDKLPFAWTTPISWANKPIVLEGPGGTVLP